LAKTNHKSNTVTKTSTSKKSAATAPVDSFDSSPTTAVIEQKAEVELTRDISDGSGAPIDDPVRMYLMQMGEIPLLTRDEEVSAAKAIDAWRAKFRHAMLANDYILQGAVVSLEKVRDGQLRLDRTIEVSVTNIAEKKRIMKRLVPNLKKPTLTTRLTACSMWTQNCGFPISC
jgi:RNA polymerase primary sigma factor